MNKQENLGLWLGVLGVTLFAMTTPMTRLATGTSVLPQLSPWFVAYGRVVLAAVLSLLYLVATRSKLPSRTQLMPLGMAVLGNAIGFPLLLGLALRTVSASHAAVITALLPLATAVVAALVLGQRARWGFWLCAVFGAVLVVVFSGYRAQAKGHGLALEVADILLVGAVLTGAWGYVYGAQVTPSMGAERVICWVCVLSLPVSLPGMLWTWPVQPVLPSAWIGFVYVGVVSMWAGFFAWYRGLAIGGALRVSQTQLLQPFLTMLFAWPILGEVLDSVSLLFAVAVVAIVLMSKRASAR